jgi:hypothetical protein
MIVIYANGYIVIKERHLEKWDLPDQKKWSKLLTLFYMGLNQSKLTKIIPGKFNSQKGYNVPST